MLCKTQFLTFVFILLVRVVIGIIILVSFSMRSGSRYSSIKVLDFCYHPVKLLKDGEYIFVPCGKCNGCLLHKANEWSQRLSLEIDNNPFSIFFTLTYNNYFLPTLLPVKSDYSDFVYFSDHSRNVRFNGSSVVPREDHIIIRGNDFIPIQNDLRKFTVNYASKLDIQLWLKLLRKDITEFLNYGQTAFRYYIISEVGPGTYRNHFHGILFPKNREIAEFLLSSSMFKNWQMCDKALFDQHCSYCDSGTSGYVSNYVSGCSGLPAIYKDPAIAPFRLSSKSPAIGRSTFDKTEIFEKIVERDLTYHRTVSRVDETFILGYPKAYLSSLFPKCYRYGTLSFGRLLWIYGYLYREVRGPRRPYIYLSQRLRSDLHVADFEAMKRCLSFCESEGATPFHYLFLLDRLYYLQDMKSLSRWYEWQESNSAYPAKILSSYNNLSDYVSNKNSLSYYQRFVMENFCEQFHICFDDLTVQDLIYFSSEDESYQQQVDDIVANLDKSKKVNEFTNSQPHYV